MQLDTKRLFIRQFSGDPDGPELDSGLLEEAEKDLGKHDDIFKPAKLWDLDSIFKERPEKASHPTFSDMLPLWIGKKAMEEVSEEVLVKYAPFMQEWDFLDLFPAYVEQKIGKDYKRRIADLGTIIDVNLMAKHIKTFQNGHCYMLEIGGGYGRLAEAFLGVFQKQIKYVLVDTVPASLVYADLYLRETLKDCSIGFYYRGHDFDLVKYDCYIMPSIYFERLNKYDFDVSINIAAMQEMTQEQIDYYLVLIDKVTKMQGQIYLSNSRDYRKRRYEYLNTWHLILKRNTPKSWTPHYPVEIFYKTDQDCTDENQLVEIQYLKELCLAYEENYRVRTKVIAEKNERIAKLVSHKSVIAEKNEILRSRIEQLSDSCKKLKERNEMLLLRSQKLTESYKKLKERN